MDKIYIIVHSVGSYSDFTQTNVCAFLDRDDADTECANLIEQLQRMKRARAAVYKHIELWRVDKPFPAISYEVQRDINTLRYNVGPNKRNAKQEKRLQELEAHVAKITTEQHEHLEAQRKEEHDFVRALDYLTDEDKNVLTNLQSPRYYDTDGDYEVEEIELRG